MNFYWVTSNSPMIWPSATRLVKNLKSRYSDQCQLVDVNISKYLDQSHATFVLGQYNYTQNELLSFFKQLVSGSNVILHLYGDVHGKMKIFKYVQRKDINIKIITGSKSFYNVLTKIVLDIKNIYYLPFYCDLDFKKNKKSHNKRLLYAGRISSHKNVDVLIDLFSRFSQDNPGWKLDIAGGIDNLRWPNNPSGFYLNYAGEMLDYNLEKAQSANVDITYHGELNESDLNFLLRSVNTFISLSTSESEDYGLGLLEALALDKSLVVTRWAGYKEFENYSNVSLLDVDLVDDTLNIDFTQFSNAILESLNRVESNFLKIQKSRLLASLPLNACQWNGLKDSFINEIDLPSINKDFFNHGSKYLSPLWEK